jgi:hypothetical protein
LSIPAGKIPGETERRELVFFFESAGWRFPARVWRSDELQDRPIDEGEGGRQIFPEDGVDFQLGVEKSSSKLVDGWKFDSESGDPGDAEGPVGGVAVGEVEGIAGASKTVDQSGPSCTPKDRG